MLTLLLTLIAFSFILSLLGTTAMQRWSGLLGLVDHPGTRKIHHTPTPKGGGVALFIGIWLPVWVGVLACYAIQSRGWSVSLMPEVTQYASGVVDVAPKLLVIFAGSLVVWILGLVDDLRNLSPWTRLTLETVVALGLVFCGIKASIFIKNDVATTILTVLWIVGLINAFNMLDNMDGLTSGVGAIIAFFFCIVALEAGHIFVAAFLCCVIGALAGFLIFNFPPASIFAGDSGSTTLGYLLAVMTVEFTFYTSNLQMVERPFFPIVVPLLMFALPIFDTMTVVWIRLRAGRSPFQGDTNHFSHRLVALGMTRRQAVLTIYLVTATVSLGATVLYYASSIAVLVIFAQAVALFTIIGILERARPQRPPTP